MKKSAVGRIKIEGEMNIFMAAGLRQRFLEALDAAAEVDVDLSQVGEIDSAGVQLMIAAKREAAARNKTLRFSGHSAPVFDVLELCDISGYLGDPVLIQSRS